MNQDNIIHNVLQEIESLDDSAKLQLAEMVLRSLREKSTANNTPQQEKVSFADLQGLGKGVWTSDGTIEEFISEERETWER